MNVWRENFRNEFILGSASKYPNMPINDDYSVTIGIQFYFAKCRFTVNKLHEDYGEHN